MTFNEFLLHIPHSSVRIPARYRKAFLIDPETELPYMTDLFTDELFDLPAQKLVFPVSRLVCDVERFRDDRLEEMSLRGMGACYTHTHDGKQMRRLDPEQRESILRRWYDPHHAQLTRLVTERVQRFGVCTIIDCHSFSPAPLPYEPKQDPDRPDVCIGTDPFHTPPRLADLLAAAFRDSGCRVRLNDPYAGTIVPLQFLNRDPRVRSVMIEVNRGLYLDSACRKNRTFPIVAQNIRGAFAQLAAGAPLRVFCR